MYIEDSKKASPVFISNHGAVLNFNNGNQLSMLHIKEIETGKICLLLTVRSNGSLSATIQMAFSELEKGIRHLSDYGLFLSKPEECQLIDILHTYSNNIPIFYSYNEVGWHKNPDDIQLFLGSEIVSCDSVAINTNTEMNVKSLSTLPDIVKNSYGFIENAKNNYSLSDSIKHLKKCGSYEKSIKFFNKVIDGKIIAQVIIATAFSSIIVGLLKHNTILLNVCGKSSIGKSRFSELATSVYSAPNDSNITATFDSTPKSLEGFLHNNNGIVTIIDDTSTGYSGEYEWTNLIYNITKGKSRKRLGKDFKPTTTLNWYTSVITSSEKSIISSCDKDKSGILRRCIEIEAGQGEIIENAQMAEQICEFSNNNYGLLGIAFVKQMVAQGYDYNKVLQMLQCETKYLQGLSDERGLYQGYAETIAHITLTAKLVHELIGINFDIDHLHEYLIEIGKESMNKFKAVSFDAQYTPEEAYKLLCKNYEETYKDYATNDNYINIPVKKFNEIEQSYGFDKGLLKKYLRDKGLIRTDSKRNDKNIRGTKCISILKYM